MKKINIEQLKEQYGEIKEITAGKKVAYFRKPDLKIWRFALAALSGSNTAFKKAMAKNCYVAGDKELVESPYLEDVVNIVDEFITYPTATCTEIEGCYEVIVGDKKCLLNPLTIDIRIQAERENFKDIAFATKQEMLNLMWISGDEAIKDEKQLDYHMPVLRIIDDLREKHVLSIKNV